MTITKSLKMLFRQMLLKAAEIETDKGMLYVDGEEAVVGSEVYKKEVADDGSENFVPAEDGEYVSNGITYVVAEGKIAEIKLPEPEVEVKEDGTAVVEAAEEVAPIEVEIEEKPVEETEEERKARFERIENRVAEMTALVEQLINKVAELQERIAKMENEPAAVPAEEVVEIEAGCSTADKIKKALGRK